MVATASDLEHPQVNGHRFWDVKLKWTPLHPALRLNWHRIAPGSFALRAGREILLPINVGEVDIDGAGFTESERPRILLEPTELPPGFELEWIGQTDAQAGVPQPQSAGSNSHGTLRVAAAESVPAGEYSLRFAIRSSHPEVPLNGSFKAVPCELAVKVPSTDAVVEILSGGKPWRMVAPVESAQRTVSVRVATGETDPLPEHELVCDADNPVTILGKKRKSRSLGSAEYVVDLSVPAQSPPFEGSIRFTAVGRSIKCQQSVSLGVGVDPVRLRVTPREIVIDRYEGWREILFGWLRQKQEHCATIDVEGAGWPESRARWRLVRASEPLQNNPGTSDQTARLPVPLPSTGHIQHAFAVRLSSAYDHTQFLPGTEIPLSIQERSVPVPFWMYAIPLGLAFAVLFVAIPPWPISVQIDSAIRTRVGRLSLGKLPGLVQLGLSLRRSLFGTTRIRWKRSHDGDFRVSIAPQFGDDRPISHGDRLRIGCGDVVEVRTADGTEYRVQLLSGRIVVPAKEEAETPGAADASSPGCDVYSPPARYGMFAFENVVSEAGDTEQSSAD